MKKNFSIITLSVIGVTVLVSCEQPSRVVEMPLGQTPAYVTPQTNEIVEQLDKPTDLGTTTGGEILNPNPQGSTIVNPGGSMVKIDPIATPTPPQAEIPYAWQDPNDPTVVRSPYNQANKIRVIKSDGTRYPSGSVMWDPNYPKSEGKKFRVP